MSNRPYRRVLLKLSGELFARPGQLDSVARQVATVSRRARIAVVLGGGNVIRGRDAADMDRVTADQAGMLATVINGMRLTDALGRLVPVSHLSAFAVHSFVPGYSVPAARAALDGRRVLVLSGGTSNPFFSTESCAALRAAELGMEAILKGTQVRGVFAEDPRANPRARFFRRLRFEQALAGKLRIMDLTAFALCMEHHIPIVVFDITRPRAIVDSVAGKRIGSIVC